MNDFLPFELPAPPTWSLTLGVIGRVLIIASASLFALSAISWLISGRIKEAAKAGKIGFAAGCYALLGAFVVLGILFAAKRYEFEYVYGHADSASGLLYRIAGIWSGQEGSFLLWGTCSAIFALMTARSTGAYRRWYTIAFAFFLGGIASILALESPFNLTMFEGTVFVPEDGVGLSPSLQNYWVIIHPPTIFLGFGSLTSLFALAFAALVTREYDKWIPIVRPWAIISATLVGLGLCMGGFWAYETLGWGGFWMWDPVENVSFVPWCFTLALIHGVIVQVTKKRWVMTNLLLASLPFLVFLYGTFLTRSGALSDTSVHSFAEMDRYALKLLLTLMIGAFVGFMGLWSYRAFQERKRTKEEDSGPVLRREGFYMLGNASLLALGVTAMLGMSVPFIQALQGKRPAVVEEWLYHQVLPWMFIPMMLLMAIAPFVSWKGTGARELANKAYTVLCITIGVLGILLVATVLTPFAGKLEMNPTATLLGRFEVTGMAWVLFLFGICLFGLVGNAWRVAELFKRSKLGLSPFLSHIGLAILVAGLIVSRGYEIKEQSLVIKDHPGQVLNYEVRLVGMTLDKYHRDNELELAFYDVNDGKEPLFIATPGLYAIDDGDHEDTMVWPHIERSLFMDTYVSLGVPQQNVGEDVTIAVGESEQLGGMTLTYKEMVRGGVMGETGATIGVIVTIDDGETQEDYQPEFSLAKNGEILSHPASLDDNTELVLVNVSAEDRSATLRAQLKTPIYPIEVYHKPMTILVWLGTGLMALAGFAAAFYRRPKSVTEADTEDP
jgi:cytochrome c-type biogenesis protein CcmF